MSDFKKYCQEPDLLPETEYHNFIETFYDTFLSEHHYRFLSNISLKKYIDIESKFEFLVSRSEKNIFLNYVIVMLPDVVQYIIRTNPDCKFIIDNHYWFYTNRNLILFKEIQNRVVFYESGKFISGGFASSYLAALIQIEELWEKLDQEK